MLALLLPLAQNDPITVATETRGRGGGRGDGRGRGRGRGGQRQMPPGFDDEVEKMHVGYCSVGDRATTHGPCLKFKLRAERKSLSKEEWDEKMKAVQDIVPLELGQEQMDEMHEFWCSRPERARTNSGPLHTLCENYVKHKEGLKKEL